MPETRGNVILPALIGGLVAGFLSALPGANCFCCLWIILGGTLAVYLYNRESPQPISSSDAVLLGILTGLIATIVDFFFSLPFQALNLAFARRFLETLSEMTEMPIQWEDWLEKGSLSHFPLPLALFSLMIRAIVYVGLGAIGGVLGKALFGRRRATSLSSTPPSSISNNISSNGQKNYGN